MINAFIVVAHYLIVVSIFILCIAFVAEYEQYLFDYGLIKIKAGY